MSANLQRFPNPLTTTVESLASSRPSSPREKVGPVSVGRVVRTVSPAATKVSLNDISLSYRTQTGTRLLALDRINLQVRTGEFLCIVGPSGCGKSTLLHLIAGLNPQTSGEIRID